MIRTIHLYGKLARFGKKHKLDVETAGEAVRALIVNYPEIQKEIASGEWRVIRGNPQVGLHLDEATIAEMKLGSADVHIMPAIRGRKGGRSSGLLKTILGVTLIAVSMGAGAWLANPIMGGALAGVTGATWGSALGMAGLGLALSGVSSLLAPETKDREETKSYTMTGPTGSVGQGNAVPLVYGGPLICSGVLISGGIDIAQMQPV